MGAKESGGKSQRWFIPVVDPKKIFKPNTSQLDIGGKFLKEKIDFALDEDDMIYEIQEWLSLINEGTYNDRNIRYSLMALKVMDKIRNQQDIVFPADLK